MLYFMLKRSKLSERYGKALNHYSEKKLFKHCPKCCHAFKYKKARSTNIKKHAPQIKKERSTN